MPKLTEKAFEFERAVAAYGYYSPRAISEKTGMLQTFLYKLIDANRLQAKRFRNRIFIDVKSVQSYLGALAPQYDWGDWHRELHMAANTQSKLNEATDAFIDW